jgi:hypothetical protein
MTNQLLTLKKVQADFKKWRKTRGKRTKIPDHLWRCAIELTNSHRITNITNALGINHSALKNRIKSTKINHIKSSEHIAFLELDVKQPTTILNGNTLVEYKRLDGSSMAVQTSCSQVVTLIETFLRGSQCYN